MERSWTRVALILTILILIAAVACEDNGPQPGTPQITEGSDDEDLQSSLLSLSEVAALPSAPDGLTEQSVEDAAFFENPDPRGPCGAEIHQPEPRDAGIIAFVTTKRPGFTSFHAVWELPAGEAEGYVDEWLADTRPNCPAFESTIPDGSQQQVQLLEVVDLPGLQNRAVATISRITVPDAPAPTYVGASMLYSGRCLSLFAAFSENPVSSRFLQQLSLAAADKL
jgi:hypothetical protein